MEKKNVSFIEKIGNKIPDPAIIFVIFYIVVLISTAIFGGYEFSSIGAGGETVTTSIKNMFTAENVRWIFSNALLNNWLGYAGGILGTILIVMFGIGIAEQSGLLSSLIRRMGTNVSDRFMPYVLVFLGILSNVATDAGYLILVPLGGLLYLGMKKNPIIGMAAAFAGVSAGFSANLIPATVVDAIIGTNAQGFAESQGIPFVSYLGKSLNPMTMHYFFMVASTIILVFIGGFITNKFIRPRFEKEEYIIPDDINTSEFKINKDEKRALKFAFLGLIISVIIVTFLALVPLKSYVNDSEKTVNPFLDNIILFITFIFFTSGLFYGFASGKFKKGNDVVMAMSKQLGSMGYVIVLTFFCYNFLALLSYSNVGTLITFIGAKALSALGLSSSPILLIIGFIIITAIINLFVGGLTSKWMLLGPIFIPMLYSVNSSMTPDVVAAAYRIADSSTNIITPLMTYSGVILMYMKKYKPDFSLGNLITTMLPFSICFIVAWTILLILFIAFKIPLGF
ncbi:MAG: AbgT family transporter [Oscillospiraceae bacterium]